MDVSQVSQSTQAMTQILKMAVAANAEMAQDIVKLNVQAPEGEQVPTDGHIIDVTA